MNENDLELQLNEDQIRHIQAITGQRIGAIRVVSSFPELRGVYGGQGAGVQGHLNGQGLQGAQGV
ncbi:hypothetical protein, partial [Pandoraea sp. 64-18]